MSFVATCQPRACPPAVTVGNKTMHFGDRAYIMGVVNVTPDSFSDGGKFLDHQHAIDHAMGMVDAGADIIDIGGESTRPGADPVDAQQEVERVLPVIEGVRNQSDVWISVDTYKSAVAAAAADAGADIINDISGLGFDEDLADTVADTDTALVLMHIRKTPKSMQKDIDYDDVVDDILGYFHTRVQRAERAGISPERVILDPGIGFGKTVEQNYRLLRELNTFAQLGHPLLVGTSRKSFIGAVIDKPPQKRLWGTAATVACSLLTGADIVRVHDVEQMADVVRTAEAIAAMGGPG